MNRKTRIITLGFAIVTAAAGVVALAGDLNPPNGPVAPTMKTLAEVEPRIAINATNTPGDNDGTPSLFKIIQPGSYYLTGNITGVAGQRGIEIAAGGVSLDLNGFEVAGVPGALGGVVALAGLTNLTVRNGTIRNWPAGGADLSAASGNALEDLTASNNGTGGILSGPRSTVVNCRGLVNTGPGIQAHDGTTVSRCAASGNTGEGISTLSGCVVLNCTATTNADDGISLGTGSTVVDCSAHGNTVNGIVAATGCTISRCNATGNTADGIEVGTGCRVMENNCHGNGAGAGSGAGIHVTGSGNRIEANNVGAGDRGIEFGFQGNNSAGTDNFVSRNTVTGGPGGVPGNYLFHPLGVQNTYGEILNFTAGGELRATNSHSWANFEF